MNNWTIEQWENLEQLSRRLKYLMDNPMKNNVAWRASLTITLDAIAGYRSNPK